MYNLFLSAIIISVYAADVILKKGRVYTFNNGSHIDVFLLPFIPIFS